MITATTFAAALASVGTLAAQSVGVTLSALTPLRVEARVGGVGSVNTWPVGVLPNSGSLIATAPAPVSASAEVGWGVPQPTSQSAYVQLTHSIYNTLALPTFAGRCGPHEFLVEFTSAIPRVATLTVSRWLYVAPGAPVPTVQLDFDNDGVIDVANLPTSGGTYPSMAFGPQPKQIRVVVDVTLGGQSGITDELWLILTPENNLTVVQSVASCNASLPPPPPLLQPSFDDRGVDLSWYSLPGQPSVLVFGFAPQPTLLSMNGPLPCILLPAPDVVLLANGVFHLPLPASVRPATFYVQGVTLPPSGILTSEGYAVQAN